MRAVLSLAIASWFVGCDDAPSSLSCGLGTVPKDGLCVVDTEVGSSEVKGDVDVERPDVTPDVGGPADIQSPSETTASTCDRSGFPAALERFVDYGHLTIGWTAYQAFDAQGAVRLSVDLFPGLGGAIGPGRYDLSEPAATCGNCVAIETGCEDHDCYGMRYEGTAGTLEITWLDTRVGAFAGVLRGVVMTEAGADETWCLDGFAFAVGPVGPDAKVYELTGPEQATSFVGGSGGELDESDCDGADEIAGGLTAQLHPQPTSISELGLKCRRINHLAGELEPADYTIGGFGDDATWSDSDCAEGELMVGVAYGIGAQDVLSGVAPRCALAVEWFAEGAPTKQQTAIGSAPSGHLDCPPGTALVALRGRMDKESGENFHSIYSLQAVCRDVVLRP